ncbi:MAG: N-acetylmuramoyl-L-alanine amidase [Mycobacteriaceae bacterium]
MLDPGHNGANAANPATINAPVPDGRGGVKSCNTTGTSTDGGYPEHAFAWDVAEQVQVVLAEAGARVVLTRSDDTGVGPCVNQRAKTGNDANADAVVSIHADGAAPAGHGFHVIYSSPPVNPIQAGPGLRMAQVMRDAMITAGFTPSSYIGSAGLNPRADIAGLNLSARPAVLVECANMRNQADAAGLSDPTGRARYGRAIADGIEKFLAAQ